MGDRDRMQGTSGGGAKMKIGVSANATASGGATVRSSTESGVSAMTAVAMAREGRTVVATASDTMSAATVGAAAAAGTATGDIATTSRNTTASGNTVRSATAMTAVVVSRDISTEAKAA